MTKKEITEAYSGADSRTKSKHYPTDIRYEIETDINNAILNLQRICGEMQAEGYYNIKIETEIEYGYYDDTSVKIYVYGTRLETDKEYHTRSTKEDKDKAQRERAAKARKDTEYKTYLKLKEKFEAK